MEYAQAAPDLVANRRLLGNFTSDQLQSLMDSGLTSAEAYDLRPCIALTADLIWLQ